MARRRHKPVARTEAVIALVAAFFLPTLLVLFALATLLWPVIRGAL